MSSSTSIAIIGLGYVGLPLGLQFARSGVSVLGVDIDPAKVADLNAGRSYIRHSPAAAIQAQRASGRLEATTDFSRHDHTPGGWRGRAGSGRHTDHAARAPIVDVATSHQLERQGRHIRRVLVEYSCARSRHLDRMAILGIRACALWRMGRRG